MAGRGSWFGGGEQPRSKILKGCEILAHVGIQQNLPIGVANLFLVVDDENPDRQFFSFCHVSTCLRKWRP